MTRANSQSRYVVLPAQKFPSFTNKITFLVIYFKLLSPDFDKDQPPINLNNNFYKEQIVLFEKYTFNFGLLSVYRKVEKLPHMILTYLSPSFSCN
jgi:hypothetical protein